MKALSSLDNCLRDFGFDEEFIAGVYQHAGGYGIRLDYARDMIKPT